MLDKKFGPKRFSHFMDTNKLTDKPNIYIDYIDLSTILV